MKLAKVLHILGRQTTGVTLLQLAVRLLQACCWYCSSPDVPKFLYAGVFGHVTIDCVVQEQSDNEDEGNEDNQRVGQGGVQP